ncbi:MAG: class I SAM-dependent methyltransferase [Saprospiraceae bacterium]|nr:class I SAM-dependent methyltransferase [Saprospiraceae bacterium]
MKKFQLKAFIKYYINACTIYDIHSPYLYGIVSHLMENQMYYAFGEIEPYRERYRRSSETIKRIDLGAGQENGKALTISQIVRRASSSKEKCRFLFNLVKYFQPQHILELGTNLGIATSYLSYAHQSGQVYTIDADSNLIKHAKELFGNLKINSRISVFNSSFDSFFAEHSDIVKTVDFAFIDGDHSYDATVNKVRAIMNNGQQRKVVVIDDIYWSQEMQEAWTRLKEDYSHCLKIELIQMGIIIQDSKCPYNHNVSLIPLKYKPWRIGLTSGRY